ncbi:MAG: SIS domain-containing protein [Candidatus Sulfotelmatobacter sp.]
MEVRQEIRRAIGEHLSLVSALLEDEKYLTSVAAAAEAIALALKGGNKVLFFGNGGSAADAQHLAAELTGRFLVERPGLPGIALSCNTSSLTAIGNDYGFDRVFARQLAGLGIAGDVAFGISTSGNSPNVLRAMEAAGEKRLIRVGLTGRGGKLASLVDYCIRIPADATPRIQEAHILTGHILVGIVERKLFATES